ncbi:uncharacterized protein LOC135837455 [Planococcus citri]|uniref:uncharacterized protein LOC135837455 n=1 Tax=Planococcus citri TaxID=170843 RepID=UPI0031F7D280
MAQNTRADPVKLRIRLIFAICSLILFVSSVSIDEQWKPFELDTSISYRKEPLNRSDPIARNASSFVELVENSDVFVDKSLLLKTIFECSHAAILVTAPKGWGKSTNLDMIKTFVQLPYDHEGNELHPVGASNSFKFFSEGEMMWHADKYGKLQNPLLVSAYDEFICDHLGKYPVVKVEMKRMAFGSTYQEVLDNVKVYLKELFDQFRFVVKPLFTVMQDEQASRAARRRSYHMLCKYATFVNMNQENVTNLQHSLKFLCGLLFNHFRRRIVILVDDYEHHFNILINNTHPPDKQDETDISYFFKSLMRFAFKDNTYLEKGVLTGAFQFGTGAHHTPNTIGEFNYVYENPLLKFYGFTQSEMEALFDYLKISYQFPEVERWYSGYHASYENHSCLVYSPPSIVEYLATRKFANTLHTRGENEIINMIMSLPKMRGSFELLINNQSITINAKSLYFTKLDIVGLQLLVQQSSLIDLEQRRTAVEVGLAYLASAGYLSLGAIKRQILRYRRMVSIQIPNNQMLDEFSKHLMLQYKQEYGISDETIELVTEKFHKCIQGDRPEFFRDSLQSLYDQVTLFHYEGKANLTFVNRSVQYSMLNLISINMRYRYQYKTVVSEEYFRPNVILYGDRHTVIVHTRTEHVLGRNRNAVLARKFRHLISTADISKITYMVWDYHLDKRIHVEVSKEILSRAGQRTEVPRY